jgi:hypothetical protein
MINKLIIASLLILLLSCEYISNEQVEKEKQFDYTNEINLVKYYAKTHNYEDKLAFFVDFSIPSNKKRLFLISLEDGKPIYNMSYLVAHGKGCGQYNGIPSGFSNTSGSNCSSIGLSVFERRDYSNWGIHIKYWLKGLESTNNNMKRRIVVIHSWEGIPDEEVNDPIVQSDGCFTVSNQAMREIDKFIQDNNFSNKILLYSFKKTDEAY